MTPRKIGKVGEDGYVVDNNEKPIEEPKWKAVEF